MRQCFLMVPKECAQLHTMDAAARARQEKAAFLTSIGKKGREVAKELGVHETTISQWKHDPEFMELVNGYQRETREAARHAIEGAVLSAVECLKEIMEGSDSTPDAVRVRAACELLDRAGLTAKNDKVSNYDDLDAMAPTELAGQLAEAVRILGRTGTAG